MPRRPLVTFAGLLVFLLANGCDRQSPFYGVTTPTHPVNEFWISNGLEPEWIDPGKCADNPGGTIINNTFEGLTQPDPHDMSPRPGVAESWEVSPDKLTWTFHLRGDAKWSDGAPVTSKDFLYSWARVLDPATGAKYADQLYDIENGEAVNQHAILTPGADAKSVETAFARFGKVSRVLPNAASRGGGYFVFFEEENARSAALAATKTRLANGGDLGLAAPDDRTFVVTLTQPVSYFIPKITTLYTYYPVPRQVIDRLVREGKNPDLWTRVENIVSNGPYVLTEWRFRNRLVFTKNPHYWDRANVKIEKVVALEIESYNTTLELYKTGEIDWIGENADIPSEYTEYLHTKKDYRKGLYLGTYWYWFNIADPAVSDKRVRHALDMAIDKRALTAHVTRQNQPAAYGVVPDGLAGFKTTTPLKYDPEAARKLLAEAGYPDGKDKNGKPLSVTLTYNTAETHKAIAEAMQAMWKKELGIDAKIENQEWQVFLRNLESRNLQMGRLGWIGDYPDPYTFLSVFLSKSGNNHAGWVNPKFDATLAESALQPDEAKRLAKLEEAEAIVLDDLPVLPVYFYTRHYLCKPYVKGLYNTFQDRHPWKAIRIDPDAVKNGTLEDGT